MNRFHQIRRMRGAAFLILVGVLALLNQWHVLRWGQSWPLFLILAGVLILAERAAWTADVRDQQAMSAGLPTYPASTTSTSGSWSGTGAEHAQPPPPENPPQEER